MVYFISGLGADERVFQFLKLPSIERKFIKWIETRKKENINDYALRLIEQIDTTQEVILIGVSFGGIIAQEIGKLINCKKIIIISSIKIDAEFSWQMKLARKTQIHTIVPTCLLIWSNKLSADYYFGTETKQESFLLQQIILDTDPVFMRWAIHQIMNWRNESYPSNLIHIHGAKDRIFPINCIKNSIEIPNGGHFMIVNKVTEIEHLIFEHLNVT